MRRLLQVCAALLSLAILTPQKVEAQTAGPSVNMVSGTGWTNGDPFLQRQNEPSLAVSTRNTLHLFGGANDYRSVDLAGLAGQSERADAWLGIFKSYDGGQTWQSTLLPGFPLDSSPVGAASPIHGFQAAADPTVRAGTNGLFFYSGIAFNRGTNGTGVVFLSRFIDNNNKENGDATVTNGNLTNLAPTDAIQYVGTVIVDSGNSGQFLDKPWIATDVPRGTATCTIPYTKADGTQGTQTIPAGQVYLTYTSFNGNQQDTKILFTSSQDCGTTFGRAVKLSESNSVNQGTIVVVDPSSANNAAATIYVAWRRFATSSQPDAFLIAKSTDGGNTWTKAIQAVTFPSNCSTASIPPVGCAFDQGTTAASFRTSAYPALAVDDTGRVYLAWSQRQPSGDARIMLAESADGVNWNSAPALVDNGPVLGDNGNPFSNLSGHGHQIMPSMSFSAGKLSLVYFDSREDHTLGFFTENPDMSSYSEIRQLEGELVGNPGSNAVFNSFVSDADPPLTSRRHSIDVQGAQAATLPAGTQGVPAFSPFRISRYLFGINPFDNLNQVEQLQVDAPDLPMFEDGTVPFFGDYIDVAATPAFLFQNGKWVFNISSTNLPVFHAVWTDNRDVVPPSDGNWMHYEPPFSASNPAGSANQSVFDPTQTVTACQVGVNDGFVASRNQNIYTSLIGPGLVVGSLGNSKPLGSQPNNPAQLLQRAFTVTLTNTTTTTRSFRITIANQPLLANGQLDPQGQASLLQFSLQTSLDVTVGAQSSIARAVFIESANPVASVTVNAQEISAPSGTLVAGGLQGFVVFNPDPNAPQILDPDNFGFANPGILTAETHNPEIANPEIANPEIANPEIANPEIANPEIANPEIANPEIANPAIVASLNSAIANPEIANPEIANPEIANPEIANQSVTDATYQVTNTGNTTTSYAVKLFQKAPLPAGVNLQLMLTKQYLLPVAQGCNLLQQIQKVVIANVPNPVFTPAGSLGDPDLPDPAVTNATLALQPGETGQVVIRANVSDPNVMQSLLAGAFTPVVVAHPANTGVAVPSATLTILSSTLPDGVVSNLYIGPVNIFGGFGTVTASISSGALPPGLTLNPANGAISGTPTTPGNYTFTVQVLDSFTPPAVATQTYSLRIATPLLINAPGGVDGVVNSPYNLSLATTGGTGNVTWTLPSGTLPPGLSLSRAGVISGTPTQVNLTGNAITLQATDSGSPAQTASVNITIRIAPLLSISTPPGSLPGAIFGVPYSFMFQANGGITPLTWSVSSGQLPPGLTLSSNGTLSGSPTATGSYTFTVQAGDSSSPSQTITINVAIQSAPLLLIKTTSLPLAGMSLPYSAPLVAAGGFGNLTWTVASGTLPAGLTLSSSGVISGTAPATGGTFTFTVQVADSSCLVSVSNCQPQTARQALSILVDSTPPAITPTITGTLGQNGWYISNVTVTWGVTDPESGVVSSVGCGSTSITADTTGLVLTCSATNGAGLHGSNTITIKRDTTPPVVIGSRTPAPNGAGWNNTNVVVSFTCSDNLSGVASGYPSGGTTLTGNTTAAGVTVAGTCFDLAGNSSGTNVGPIKIDKTPPTISINGPANGGTYFLNSTVASSYSCSDALSGISTCVGPVASGTNLNTSTFGTQNFTVTATDVAGNQTQVTNTYTVGYNFVGFLSPLGSAGTVSAPSFSGTVKQGSAAPLKWELLDGNGGVISSLSTLTSIVACPNSGPSGPPGAPCILLYSPTTGAKGNSAFRFSSPQFIFNWDTTSTIGSVAGFFTVEVQLNDGSPAKATTIQFK